MDLLISLIRNVPIPKQRSCWFLLFVCLGYLAAFHVHNALVPYVDGTIRNQGPPVQLPSISQHSDESLLHLVNRHFGIQSLQSDVATLQHCNLSKILQSSQYLSQHDMFHAIVLDRVRDSIDSTAKEMGTSVSEIKDEVSLQILELFARAAGACDFSKYQHPAAAQLQQRMANVLPFFIDSPQQHAEEAVLIFVIAAFQDFVQLEELVRAIHLPQHLILIHLEQRAHADHTAQVHRLSEMFPNVHLLQFGTIIYPSDSLSQIHHAILQFIASMATSNNQHHGYHFDYVVTLGETSYPLYGSQELARFLFKAPKRIRLGILHGGDARLCRRRAASLGLFYTRHQYHKARVADIYDIINLLDNNSSSSNSSTISMTTNTTMIPVSAFGPKGLKQTCRLKTTSGNTAAFDRESVLLLANSTTVKDYFARFKQAGQCCVEESSWGAAFHAIGRRQEIPMVGAMWQAWPCGRSMTNSYLTNMTDTHHNNSSSRDEFCLRMDDKSVYPNGPVELRTKQEVENALIHGKQMGHLFARKFHSKDRYWMEWIQTDLHNQYTPEV